MDNRRPTGRMGHQDGQRMHKRPRSVWAPETCTKIDSRHYDFYGHWVCHRHFEILRSFPYRGTRFRIRLRASLEVGRSWSPDFLKYSRLNHHPLRQWQKGGACNLIHNRTHFRPWACHCRHVQNLQNLKLPHNRRCMGPLPSFRDVQCSRNQSGDFQLHP